MTSPTLFRKKPVVIEAVQFTGTGQSCTEVGDFIKCQQRWKTCTYDGGYIVTLEGEMEFSPGDWIIKGVNGEFYPCKPDIFAKTYEPVNAYEPAPDAPDPGYKADTA